MIISCIVRGIIIQLQPVIRIVQLPSRIIPDDHLGEFLSGFGSVAQVLPQPALVNPLGRLLLLNPDASVAGLFAQVPFAPGIAPGHIPGLVRPGNLRHLVNQDAVVDPDRHLAEHIGVSVLILQVEIPGPADAQEFAGRRLVPAGPLFWVVVPRGAQHRGPQLSFPVYVQPLPLLVNHDAVGLVHLHFLQEGGLHIPLEFFSVHLHPGTLRRGGISLDQAPLLAPLQHVNPLAGSGNLTGVLRAVFIRLLPDFHLVPLVRVQHRHRLRQHFPDSRLVRISHRRGPVAHLMVAPDRASLSRGMPLLVPGQERRVRRKEFHRLLLIQLRQVQQFPQIHFLLSSRHSAQEQHKARQQGQTPAGGTKSIRLLPSLFHGFIRQ